MGMAEFERKKDEKINKIKRQKQVLGSIFFLFRLSWSWSPAYLIFLLCSVIIKILQPFPAIIFPAWIVDSLLRGGTLEEALLPVLGLAGSTFILAMLNTWIQKKQTLLQSGFKDFLNYKISEKQQHISLEKMESVEVKELFVRADNAISGNISYAARSLGGDRGVDAVGSEAVNLVSGAVKAVVLAVSLLWLGIVPMLLIMTALVFHVFGGNREKRANYEERVKTAPYRNKNQYVTNVMIDFGFAKEVRLYGLQEFLLGQFWRNKEYFYAARNQAKPAFYFSHMLGVLGELMQTAAAYGCLVVRMFQGSLTLGGFTGYAAALHNLSQTLVSMVRSYLNFNLYGEYFIDFMMAMEMEEETEVLETARTAVDVPEHTICFKEVSFTYPGMKTRALDRVSVEVPLKGSISIVGRNGSGKSTLIKLLLRLYQPDEGRIFLDGVDIWTIPLEEYRQQMTAVFQDYYIFALNIRENITVTGQDDGEIWEALRKAGVENTVQELPKKLDTPLFRNYHGDGVDLSGGEKQKLAIARMLHRDTAVMILDEPTAALDPRSELEIYEQIHRMAKEKTILYISHRMSSCHFSDMILVMEGGRIEEQGTHANLMENRQLYYQMYQAQAEMYRGGEAV